MSLSDASTAEAVIICTRNRPADLRRTLGSIADLERSVLVMVVDASDEQQAFQNRRITASLSCSTYLAYPSAPSLPCQRNYGIEHLPDAIEVTHFLDDDVTVQPGYFRHLTAALRAHPKLGGVGGVISESNHSASGQLSLAKKFFLLHSSLPGRVLPSGHTMPARPSQASKFLPVQWLRGVSSSYRRAVFDRFRFDSALPDYAMLEDLDFSYRVGREWELAVVPTARLVHHVSPKNRYDAFRLARTSTIHRYWFVEKNINHPLRKPAFWWSVLGRLLALLSSRKPEKWDALRGLWQGIRAVWQRDHPLLQRNRQ